MVEDEGRRIAIRQIELGSSDVVRRYSWQHPGDEYGFLTDQPLDEAEGVVEVSRAEFERVWNSYIDRRRHDSP